MLIATIIAVLINNFLLVCSFNTNECNKHDNFSLHAGQEISRNIWHPLEHNHIILEKRKTQCTSNILISSISQLITIVIDWQLCNTSSINTPACRFKILYYCDEKHLCEDSLYSLRIRSQVAHCHACLKVDSSPVSVSQQSSSSSSSSTTSAPTTTANNPISAFVTSANNSSFQLIYITNAKLTEIQYAVNYSNFLEKEIHNNLNIISHIKAQEVQQQQVNFSSNSQDAQNCLDNCDWGGTCKNLNNPCPKQNQQAVDFISTTTTTATTEIHSVPLVSLAKPPIPTERENSTMPFNVLIPLFSFLYIVVIVLIVMAGIFYFLNIHNCLRHSHSHQQQQQQQHNHHHNRHGHCNNNNNDNSNNMNNSDDASPNRNSPSLQSTTSQPGHNHHHHLHHHHHHYNNNNPRRHHQGNVVIDATEGSSSSTLLPPLPSNNSPPIGPNVEEDSTLLMCTTWLNEKCPDSLSMESSSIITRAPPPLSTSATTLLPHGINNSYNNPHSTPFPPPPPQPPHPHHQQQHHPHYYPPPPLPLLPSQNNYQQHQHIHHHQFHRSNPKYERIHPTQPTPPPPPMANLYRHLPRNPPAFYKNYPRQNIVNNNNNSATASVVGGGGAAGGGEACAGLNYINGAHTKDKNMSINVQQQQQKAPRCITYQDMFPTSGDFIPPPNMCPFPFSATTTTITKEAPSSSSCYSDYQTGVTPTITTTINNVNNHISSPTILPPNRCDVAGPSQ